MENNQIPEPGHRIEMGFKISFYKKESWNLGDIKRVVKN